MDRVTADHMGMLATVINALALQDALERQDIETRVMTAIQMRQVAEPYIRRRAIRHLEKGRVVIFAAGTSNPYFSTDTAATLRALEIRAQIVAKATRVDGVYDKDPEKHPDASLYEEISYHEVLTKSLGVMDASAIAMCRDNDLPILVFNLTVTGNIMRMCDGRNHRNADSLDRSGSHSVSGPWGAEYMSESGSTTQEIKSSTKARMGRRLSTCSTPWPASAPGRASISLLDGIKVDYYGTPTPLNQLATLHVPEPSMITAQPWDVSQIGAIEKAILTSDLGLNPTTTASSSAFPFPPSPRNGARNSSSTFTTSPRTTASPSATSAATPTTP